MATDEVLAEKFRLVWRHLNERQRRVLLGAEAKVRGRGGISQVAEASGVSWPTVQKSVRELEQPEPALPPDRSRRAGGGRKPVELKDPGLMEALDALVDPDSRGDPESPLRWTVKSTRQLADALRAQGHPVSHRVVGELLHSMGYSLQLNRKTIEGAQHPDRTAQFNYLHDQIEHYLKAGQPVVSVDTKKKELVGQFKNAGQDWRPKGQPERVKVHDFEDEKLGKAARLPHLPQPLLPPVEAHPDHQVLAVEVHAQHDRACDSQQTRPYSGPAHVASSTNPYRMDIDRDRIRSGVRPNLVRRSSYPHKVQETLFHEDADELQGCRECHCYRARFN